MLKNKKLPIQLSKLGYIVSVILPLKLPCGSKLFIVFIILTSPDGSSAASAIFDEVNSIEKGFIHSNTL